MNVIKRILLFLGCYLVLTILTGAIIGGMTTMKAMHEAGSVANPLQVGLKTGWEIGQRCGLFIWLGSLVISGRLS